MRIGRNNQFGCAEVTFLYEQECSHKQSGSGVMSNEKRAYLENHFSSCDILISRPKYLLNLQIMTNLC